MTVTRRGRARAFTAAAAVAASAGLASLGGDARAQDADADACIAANERAVSLLKTAKLVEARKELAACAASSCPDAVESSCRQRLMAIARAIPTIVFDVKDGAGNDLAAVSVAIDGAAPARITGASIELDPGDHEFVFTAEGQPPATKHFLLNEGETNRVERVTIGAVQPPATATAAPGPAPAVPTPSATEGAPRTVFWTAQRTLGAIGAGVGVAGLAVGAVFGGFALSDKNQEQSNCSTGGCPNAAQAKEDYDTGTTNATVSTVAFVAGGVFLAAGAVLFFTARAPRSATASSASVYLVPSATGRGPGLVLGGSL